MPPIRGEPTERNIKVKKSDHPLLKEKDALKEVCNRTGLPYNVAYQVITNYQEIIKECVSNGVDIKFGDMGRFGWKNKPPRYGVVYYNIQTGKNMDPVDTPGFWIPTFTPTRKWRIELKEQTKFWEKENEKEEK